MEFRSAILIVCLAVITSAMAAPDNIIRERRDVLESMKSAWNEMVKTLSDASDAVVHVFKPTEKSVIDKIADGIKGQA